MPLRTHQQSLHEFAQDPACGIRTRTIIADVTPAGGKSTLPVIAGYHLIRRGIVEKICILTPRLTLRTQAEEAFVKGFLRDALDHTLEIKAASGGDINPDKGTAGFASNYQGVPTNIANYLDYFRRYRTLLCLDEAHHLDRDGVWHRATQPIWDLAPVRLLMSGTFSRHDGAPLAYVDYQDIGHGTYAPDLTTTLAQHVIRYDWRDALHDRAIKRLETHHLDGNAKWRDPTGNVNSVDSIRNAGKDAGAALFTAINENYATELLQAAHAHYQNHRRGNAGAKFLCVAPNIQLAKRYLRDLQRAGFDNCAIATSDDTPAALAMIERFKGKQKPTIDGLVTVGMAYEGLDCPPITHIALLTHIRSVPWIAQAIARAMRIDEYAGPYERQRGHVFAPDDAELLECIAKFKQGDRPLVVETHNGGGGSGGGSGGGGNSSGDTIVPVDAEATTMRSVDFGTGDETDPREEDILSAAMDDVGIYGVSTIQIKQLLARINCLPDDLADAPTAEPPTVSQRMAKNNHEIDNWVSRWVGQQPNADDKDVQKLLYRRAYDILGQAVAYRADASEPQQQEIIRRLPQLLQLRVW